MAENNNSVPVIVVEDIVIFPGEVINFEVTGKVNITAVELAAATCKPILVVSKCEDFGAYDGDEMVGTLADVRQLIKLSPSVMRIVVYGRKRVLFDRLAPGDKVFTADVRPFYTENVEKCAEEAMLREIRMTFGQYKNVCANVNKKFAAGVDRCRSLERAVDMIASNIRLEYEDRIKLLITPGVVERFNLLQGLLNDEIKIANIRDEIHNKVKGAVDKNQKEYYLREQIRIIREELGDSDSESDADRYLERCRNLNASDEVKEKIAEEIRRFRTISSNSSESTVIRTYIETLLDMPWRNASEDMLDIDNAKKVLDNNHYGLAKVKERIAEMLAVRQLAEKGDAPILCLVGPPGTGKTSIARSVAEALGKKYVRICLGGVRDEAEIRGHRKTYVGAMPGRIVTALKKAKVSNPLILLDEIDKVSNDYKGDTFSALLEVLDPEQNEFFTDHYIEVPVDLSGVLFICTANDTSTIPGPLLDRMEIIEVSGYTENEKFHIAKRHLIAKQRKKNGITASSLKIADSAIRKMILSYTREAGVRGLERTIARVCRKAAKSIIDDRSCKITVTARNLEEYLGRIKYEPLKANKKAQVGIARGLAWTSVGGVTLEIEVNTMPGKGELLVTGKLGDVMKESAMAAKTYVRSLSGRYGIDSEYYSTHDIHIHIPEGAVPKDGPSAGITMATAVLSAVVGLPVRADIAMTGEITLRGRVLPIGGLKEKLLAAYDAGIRTVLVPDKNRKDVEDIDEEITGKLEIIYVSDMKHVIENAIVAADSTTLP